MEFGIQKSPLGHFYLSIAGKLALIFAGLVTPQFSVASDFHVNQSSILINAPPIAWATASFGDLTRLAERYGGFNGLLDEAHDEIAHAHHVESFSSLNGCLSQAEAMSIAQITVASQSVDKAHFDYAVRTSDRAFFKLRREAHDVERGSRVAYKRSGWKIDQFDLAKSAAPGWKRRLYNLALQDQADRSAIVAIGATVAHSQVAIDRTSLLMRPLLCEDSRIASQWLKGIVAKRGWVRKDIDGPDAETAAWMIVQHADMDVSFQSDTLKLIEPLVMNGQSSAEDFPYLTDRVLRNTGKLQHFGTQGFCLDRDHWKVFPVDDEATVDLRRAKFGLPTVAEYESAVSVKCRLFIGK